MPVPFDVRVRCDQVARRRGRPIRLVPMAGLTGVCGLWLATAYRNQPGAQGGTASIYATAPFVAPAGKQLASVTLPAERDLHVFAVGLG